VVKGRGMARNDMGAERTAPPAVRGAEQARPSSLALPIGLAVMAATLVLTLLAAQPPAPRPATAPASAFSAARAMATLERLLGDGAAHPIGSRGNAEVAARIGDELAAMGYAVETQTTFVCRAAWAICGTVTNVLSRLPGTGDGPAVLLTAHYDSVPAGPGAADDMAGVATILEVARILRGEATPRNPVIVLFSDGEEIALLGAEAFVAEHPWADQVGAVVNLEANGTHGQSVLFETAGDNTWLIDVFAAASRPVASSVFDAIYELIPFNTDLSVYEEAGLAGFNFAFIDEHPQYHTPLDNPANLSPGSLQHHGDNTLALARALGATDLANPPPGRSVFQDLFSLVLLRWPEPWTAGIALVVAAGWVGVGIAAARRGDLSMRPLMWGLLAFPAGVAAAAGLGFVLGEVVKTVSGAAIPWYAVPLPMRVAAGVASLLATVVLASALARRAGFWGRYLGVWCWWALLSVAVALVFPGLSPLALIPATLAAVAALVVTVSKWRGSSRTWEIAALIGLFATSWAWLGFTRGSDYSALGPDLGPTVGVAVGLAATALMPVVAPAAAYGRFWRPTLAGAVLLTLLSAAVATQVPPSSAARPQRLNLFHVQERGADRAWWAIETFVPFSHVDLDSLEELRQAGGFVAETARPFPWSSEALPVAPAPPIPDHPVVELVSDEIEAGQRIVTVELRSAASEHRISLYVPVSAGLGRVLIPGSPHDLEGFPVEDDFGRFHCVGAGCDGLRLELHLANGGPVTLFAAERSPGLPEGGAALVAARPETAAPSGGGDETIVIDRLEVAGQ
jgi:hypothetical protein